MSAKSWNGGWVACAKCGRRAKRSPDRQVGAKFYHLDCLAKNAKVVDAENNRMQDAAAWSGLAVFSEKKYGDTKAAVKKQRSAAERERKLAVKQRQAERAAARKAKAAAKASA